MPVLSCNAIRRIVLFGKAANRSVRVGFVACVVPGVFHPNVLSTGRTATEIGYGQRGVIQRLTVVGPLGSAGHAHRIASNGVVDVRIGKVRQARAVDSGSLAIAVVSQNRSPRSRRSSRRFVDEAVVENIRTVIGVIRVPIVARAMTQLLNARAAQ